MNILKYTTVTEMISDEIKNLNCSSYQKLKLEQLMDHLNKAVFEETFKVCSKCEVITRKNDCPVCGGDTFEQLPNAYLKGGDL